MVWHPKTSSVRKMLPSLGVWGMGKNNVMEAREPEELSLQQRGRPTGAGSMEKHRPLPELWPGRREQGEQNPGGTASGLGSLRMLSMGVVLQHL